MLGFRSHPYEMPRDTPVNQAAAKVRWAPRLPLPAATAACLFEPAPGSCTTLLLLHLPALPTPPCSLLLLLAAVLPVTMFQLLLPCFPSCCLLPRRGEGEPPGAAVDVPRGQYAHTHTHAHPLLLLLLLLPADPSAAASSPAVCRSWSL